MTQPYKSHIERQHTVICAHIIHNANYQVPNSMKIYNSPLKFISTVLFISKIVVLGLTAGTLHMSINKWEWLSSGDNLTGNLPK